MPSIVINRRATSQPAGDGQIDFGHPLLTGVKRLWSMHEGRLREYIYQRSVAIEAVQRPFLGYSANLAVNNNPQLFGTEGACLSGDITVFAVCELIANGTNQSLMCRNASGMLPGADTSQFVLGASSGNQPTFNVRDAGVGSVLASEGALTSGNAYSTVMVGRVQGIDVALFRDGRKVATATLAGALATTAVTQQYAIGNNPNFNGNFQGYASLMGVLDRAASDAEIAELCDNPWQLFRASPRRIYFDIPAGIEAVTADGTPDAVSLTAPTGAAAVSVAASGALDAVTLTAPTGAAAVSVTAAGAVAPLSLSAPTGAAAVEVSAAGAIDAVTLTAPTGTADTVSTVIAAGAVAPLSLSAPTGAAAVEVAAAGPIDAVSLTAPTGTASTVSTVVAAGAVAALSLTVPTGAAAVEVAASGALDAVTLTAPNGAAGTVTTVVAAGAVAPLGLSAPVGAADVAVAVAGLISEITLSAPAGNASTGATVTAAGAIAPLSLTPPAGAHAVSVAAFGDVRRLQLVPPTGSASDGSVSYIPRPGFTVGASIRRRFDA